MRLSEAIRLGAMMKPQAFGELMTTAEFRTALMGQNIRVVEITGTCALGAAMDAVGELPTASIYEMDYEYDGESVFPQLAHVVGDCPVAGCAYEWPAGAGRKKDLDNMIPHLNDEHLWTRERIADWVATVEPKECECVQVECREEEMVAV